MSEKKSWLHKFRAKFWNLAMCAGIVAACLGLLFHHYQDRSGLGLIAQMENKLLDYRFVLRGEQKPQTRLGILAIDEKSLQKFGRWPIDRRIYEKAFANLKKAGAEWIGFDVVWSEPQRPEIDDVKASFERMRKLKGDNWKDKLDGELDKIDGAMKESLADQAVQRMVKDYEKIVLGYFYYSDKRDAESLGDRRFAGLPRMAEVAGIQGVVLPEGVELTSDAFKPMRAYGVVANIDPIAASAENFGFFNNDSDPDAIMRWITLVRIIDGNLMPSLALKMAAKISGREIVVFFDQRNITEIVLMNPENDQDLIKIPVDHTGYGRLLLNHLGPDKTIPHFSLADAYDDNFSPEARKILKGRSLLLGPTAIAINDQRANPFDAGINGVENHAAAIDNMLSKKVMRRTESIYLTELAIVVAIGLFFTPIMVFGQAAFSGVATLVFLAGYYLFDRYFWFGRGEWVYMGMPFIEMTSLFVSTTMYKYVIEEREKRKVKGTLSLYLSPDVVTEVLDEEQELKLGGERKELTVFFSDVRGFTTLSEGLDPEKLGELMNLYFTPMTDIIQRSKGTLDKYIGDAIMAFWGAPLPMPDQADVACQVTLDMLVALDKLNAELKAKNFQTLDIGIGLNTGPMSVGNFGSPQRFTYTVMSDSVNLGARLEGQTKDYGVKIIISEFTKAKLTGAKSFYTRELDLIRVKGKHEPVRIYELVRPDVLRNPDHIKTLIGEFEEARRAFTAQNWSKAKAHLAQCLLLRPDDGPAAVYMKRIKEFEEHPLPADWDGVYIAKSK